MLALSMLGGCALHGPPPARTFQRVETVDDAVAPHAPSPTYVGYQHRTHVVQTTPPQVTVVREPR
jgi:hypothetical protein